MNPAAQLLVRLASNPALRYRPFWDKVRLTAKEEMLRRAMNFAHDAGLEGDYLEFGVWRGASFIAAYHLARRAGVRSMHFYAFDSFQGLPPLSGVDAEETTGFQQGQYTCDRPTFEAILKKNGVNMSAVTVVPGWYEESLTEETRRAIPLKTASVIWIDCDLYESTVPVLNFVTDYVKDGTLMIFDDWFAFRGNPNRGHRKAFQEWLGQNPTITATEYRKFGWKGLSFILHRADEELARK